MTEDKLEFTRSFLIFGNLALIGWIIIAFVGIFLYNKIYGLFYLVIVTVLIYAILRRLACNSCYRCKSCTSGFGRLAGIFFGKGYIKRESVVNRKGLIIFLYFLLFVLPTVVMSISLVQAFFLLEVLILLSLLTIAFYSSTTWLTTHSISSRKS